MDIQITPDELALLMPPQGDVKYCYFSGKTAHTFFWVENGKLNLRLVTASSGRLVSYNAEYSNDCAKNLCSMLNEQLCTKD